MNSTPILSIDELVENASAPDASETQEYFINMGPQHPATHGVLRLLLKLDGERVRKIIPVLGYIHRGIEKIAENQSYRQMVHLTDRMDYLSAIINNWGVSMAVEKAAGIELNPRIETIRTIFSELERLRSHQLWWGVMGMDLGAFTPFLYCFRDRELLNDIMEKTIGARLTMNYIQPGGLMHDVHEDFVDDVKGFLKGFKSTIDEYDQLLSGNVIFQERVRNVGIMDGATALDYGATGPVLRGSGVAYDLRKVEPYGVYDQVDFDVPVGTTGDSWDRYWIRIEEMRQSVRIIEQLIDNIPDGKHMVVKMAQKIKIPQGRYYSQVETARGVLGTWLVSESEKKEGAYRVHFRSPCFNNLWTLIPMVEGDLIGSLVACMASIDLVIPDIDR